VLGVLTNLTNLFYKFLVYKLEATLASL